MRSTTISKSISVATESISFQKTIFFNELVNCVNELRKIDKKELNDNELVGTLSKIVKHHTGLNITFEIGEDNPCVEIPNIDKNNILINSIIRNYVNSTNGIKLINKANGVVRGSVNLNTGLVTGIFTDIKSIIHMPLEMFSGAKYESEEIVAIILHEIGHLFTYYEFITRTISTNQVLAGIAKGLDNSDNVDQREAVLISVKKSLNLTELDTRELAKSNSNKVAELVVVSNISRETTSELGSNIYDFSTWEYLADQYAARNGASRYLVTSLAKLYKGSFNISFRSLPLYLAMEALKLIVLCSSSSILPIYLSLILIGIDSNNTNPTYDSPEARFKRIRNQITENLKDNKLSKDDISRLDADLVVIDMILKDVNDRRQFLGIVWDTIAVWNYKDRDQKKLQQNLETICANEIFIKAAELKLVA